jgi:hypothetical protein
VLNSARVFPLLLLLLLLLLWATGQRSLGGANGASLMLQCPCLVWIEVALAACTVSCLLVATCSRQPK